MVNLDQQIRLIYFGLNLKKQLNPLRPLRHWYAARQIRKHMMPLLLNIVENYENMKGPKTILQLAFKSYAEENTDATQRGRIPVSFLDRVINHLKMFMFAGHDTTASTLAFLLHLLSLHPEIAAKVCAEHDEVLGPNPDEAPGMICQDPTLLNKLPYTLAVMKETLRLYPPLGGTIRETHDRNFMLTNPRTGARYPMHGLMIHASNATVSRDPNLWVDAEKFVPERWLVRDENDPLYPPKGGWRPFEMGPRNCIGQELVSLEIRLVVALTVREFNIVGDYPKNSTAWKGMQAYQVEPPDSTLGHVKDKLPSRVLLRKR